MVLLAPCDADPISSEVKPQQSAGPPIQEQGPEVAP